jgi:hypothetical protein
VQIGIPLKVVVMIVLEMALLLMSVGLARVSWLWLRQAQRLQAELVEKEQVQRFAQADWWVVDSEKLEPVKIVFADQAEEFDPWKSFQ